MRRRARAPAASQASLAASIAREIQSALPSEAPSVEVTDSVEATLLGEARANEMSLAYFRVVALAAFTLLAVVTNARPSLAGAVAFPDFITFGLALCTALSIALVAALRGGWYQPWLGHAVPVADALLIASATLVLYREPALRTTAALPGVTALAASACVFLAFSGSIRLTRSGQGLATSLALIDWALIAWISGLRLVPAVAIAVILLATGILGARYTVLIRRVIADEVARRSLDHLYRDAQAAVRARQEVLQKVAHDLRTPLAAVRGYSELLLDPRHRAEDEPARLDAIMRSTDAMNRLISDLLDIARMEAGEIHLERRSTRPRQIVELALETMAPIAAEGGVALFDEAPTDLPRLDVDPDRIAQVFTNLIGNAVKFTPEGGRVTVGAGRVDRGVRFTVSDTGPGIPPEQASHVFEGFWQANAGDRRGIGIGLAIARTIVDAHGGRIGVDCPPGGGSTFWFTLPLARRERGGRPTPFPTRAA